MECKGRFKNILKDNLSGRWRIEFETNEDVKAEIDEIKDKDLTITAKIFRRKRSLNANAYAWVLMQKLADKYKMDKWSVYLSSLINYSGQYAYIIVRPCAVETFKREWRTVVDLGHIKVYDENGNAQDGVQLQCYYGSSTFNTAEMSRFIDGLVNECKSNGIETLSPNELERMKQQWGV